MSVGVMVSIQSLERIVMRMKSLTTKLWESTLTQKALWSYWPSANVRELLLTLEVNQES